MFDYFYEAQAEQFAFYRIPKVLFTHDWFKYLSAEAKVLYGILLDRVALSGKNGWYDSKGRIYIICTIEEIMASVNCGNKKAGQLLTELEDKAGLIERRRQGLGKPNLIYVKNFIADADSSAERHSLKCRKDISGRVEKTSLEVSKGHGTNTDYTNTDYNNTDLILSDRDMDGIREHEQYEAYFRRSLEINVLLHDRHPDNDIILGILDLLADVCSSKRKTIRIAGEDKPLEVVKRRFMKLDCEHIRYVLTCIRENTSDVRNIRQYLLATLYNAPATMGSYYQALVNHDLYG